MQTLTSLGRKAASSVSPPNGATRWYRVGWRIGMARCAFVAVAFTIAFVVDQATQQRHSAIWGSAAIIASTLAVIPAIRPAALAFGGYGLIWGMFNLGRAVADDTGIVLARQSTISSLEAGVFGGVLPTTRLQNHLYDPQRLLPHDVALAMVHLSFFVTPFLVSVALWFRRRDVFGGYCRATAITFGLGLIGFLLLPTAPPWMSDPTSVTRITTRVMTAASGEDASWRATSTPGDALAFEPNHVAALPSVHVAIAVLVFLALRSFSPRWSVVGAGYALAMTVAVVYLGEHFLLDALLGWAIALLGWHLGSRFTLSLTPSAK